MAVKSIIINVMFTNCRSSDSSLYIFVECSSHVYPLLDHTCTTNLYGGL